LQKGIELNRADRVRRYRKRSASVFQGVKAHRWISVCFDDDQDCFCKTMRLSWPQHLEASRTLERAGDGQQGMALALMGISLLILAEDLLESQLGSEASAQD
jgi:hypothetical protein